MLSSIHAFNMIIVYNLYFPNFTLVVSVYVFITIVSVYMLITK